MKTVKPAGTLPKGGRVLRRPPLPGPGNATAAAQAWPGGGVEGDAAENHKEILQELLSAYFWEKVQARCSPSECRLCPRSSLTRRNLSSLPPLQPDQLTQAPPTAAAAAVGHQTLLLQVPSSSGLQQDADWLCGPGCSHLLPPAAAHGRRAAELAATAAAAEAGISGVEFPAKPGGLKALAEFAEVLKAAAA